MYFRDDFSVLFEPFLVSTGIPPPLLLGTACQETNRYIVCCSSVCLYTRYFILLIHIEYFTDAIYRFIYYITLYTLLCYAQYTLTLHICLTINYTYTTYTVASSSTWA